MKKIYGIRKIGTDLWASSFSCGKANLGPFGHNTRLFRKIGPAKGLANKHNKLTDNYVEVVEFDLTEVKKVTGSPEDWQKFKDEVRKELEKMKPLRPFYPYPASPSLPYNDTPKWVPPRKGYEDYDDWRPRFRPMAQGLTVANEPIMMNTPENPSLMVASATGE